MKVLHVSETIQGGIASYLDEMVPAQCAELGTRNVTVVINQREVQYLEKVDRATLRTFRMKKRGLRGLLSFSAQVHTIIQEVQPDIVHLHSSFAGAMVRARSLLPRSRPFKIVYCAHGWAFNMQVSEAKRRLYLSIERWLIRVSDAVICISDFEYREALRRRFPQRLLHRIYNGIASVAPDADPAIVAWQPDKLNLLFVGRHDRQKGYDLLIKAMMQLRDQPIVLHVVGGAVVSEPAPEAMLPNVIHYGWQPRRMIASYMAAADALVMPSRWEGFGLAAVEAMRQQLPVCASAVDALPEIVREGTSGYLFPPGNAEAIAERLSHLDKAELARLGGSARTWFLQEFTADRMNRSILDLYRRLRAV